MSTPAAEAPLKSRTAVRTLAAAAGLGVLGDVVFNGANGPGLNLFLWVAALCAAAALIEARTARRHHATRWLLVATGFASCFAIRETQFLRSLDLLAMLLAAGLPGLAMVTSLARARLLQFFFSGAATAGNVAAGGILLATDIDWASQRAGRSRRAVQVALGVLLTFPVIVVFGSLFAEADPAFAAIRDSLLSFRLDTLFEHVFAAALFAWLAAGLMRSWLVPSNAAAMAQPAAFEPFMLRAPLPATMAVGAMLLMFTLFVGLQVRWLFGGSAVVMSVAGLSYAEYARSGFFQMVAAAGLAIPVLYGADVMVEGADARTVSRVRVMGRAQLVLIGLVMASALSRMMLYMTMYGLTQDRLLCVAIIGWLAAVSSWFAFTVLRGQRDRFLIGAITSGFAVLAVLNAVNPDALIARVNTTRIEQGRQLDYKYLATLSADATPVLAARLGSLPAEARCHLAVSLLRFHEADRDWRTWSRSREQARSIARDVTRHLEGCPLPETRTARPTPEPVL